jgi:hypothetical protein
MDTSSPIPEYCAMAFTAKQVRLLEFNEFTITQWQKIIAFIGVVAIQAPYSDTPMSQLQVRVHIKGLPSFVIHREVLFRAVTGATRCYGLRQLSLRNRKLLVWRGFGRQCLLQVASELGIGLLIDLGPDNGNRRARVPPESKRYQRGQTYSNC